MHRILQKIRLTDDTTLIKTHAPEIASSALPGQFIIAMAKNDSERIPLTLCDWDEKEGSITLVIQKIGYSSTQLCELNVGDDICHIAGPLGKPSELINKSYDELSDKKIIFITGGVGTAPVYPQVKYLSKMGLAPYVIMGARRRDLIILEDEMRAVAKKLYICTDSGDYGFHGMVTDMLNEVVRTENLNFDMCVAIGPMIMMKFVCLLTKKLNIPTTVSLNPIMVDGTGMCGACRVTVGGNTKFACVDGPEFNGHLVDFDSALKRLGAYKKQEAHECNLFKGVNL